MSSLTLGGIDRAAPSGMSNIFFQTTFQDMGNTLLSHIQSRSSPCLSFDIAAVREAQMSNLSPDVQEMLLLRMAVPVPSH